jgi:hypothetical protein
MQVKALEEIAGHARPSFSLAPHFFSRGGSAFDEHERVVARGIVSHCH